MTVMCISSCVYVRHLRSADRALQAELSALREDLAPSMLQQPLSLDDTAAAFIRPQLQSSFLHMCRQAPHPVNALRTSEGTRPACVSAIAVGQITGSL